MAHSSSIPRRDWSSQYSQAGMQLFSLLTHAEIQFGVLIAVFLFLLHFLLSLLEYSSYLSLVDEEELVLGKEESKVFVGASSRALKNHHTTTTISQRSVDNEAFNAVKKAHQMPTIL